MPARILLSAPADKPWIYGSHLAVALTHVVEESLHFDFRSVPDPNSSVLQLAQKFRPNIHVIWKGNRYEPHTLTALQKMGIFNVLWHPDISVPSWLPPLADSANLCCVQSSGMLDSFRDAGIRDPHWLMEGLTPECFEYDSISAKDREKYTCDVMMVGTIGHKPAYQPRVNAINRLIREGFHVKWWGKRFPRRLSAFRDWFSPAIRAYGGSRIWDAAYGKACACARIFLALPSRPEISGGLSNRAFMATGLGAFYLSLYRNGMEDFFEIGKEVDVFHDHDEMLRKVQYYLTHENERQAIARAGQARTLRSYTNQDVFQRLLKMVSDCQHNTSGVNPMIH